MSGEGGPAGAGGGVAADGSVAEKIVEVPGGRFSAAEELLRDPDAEDCERFVSRYGRDLLARARAGEELLAAAKSLGAMPEGYCFCSRNRVGGDSKAHEPECRDLRSAISKAEGLNHG